MRYSPILALPDPPLRVGGLTSATLASKGWWSPSPESLAALLASSHGAIGLGELVESSIAVQTGYAKLRLKSSIAVHPIVYRGTFFVALDPVPPGKRPCFVNKQGFCIQRGCERRDRLSRYKGVVIHSAVATIVYRGTFHRLSRYIPSSIAGREYRLSRYRGGENLFVHQWVRCAIHSRNTRARL